MAVLIEDLFGRLIEERNKPVKGESPLDKYGRESSITTLTIYKNRAVFLPDELLQHIHGTPERGTPKLMELGGQINEQRQWLQRMMRGQDPFGL